MANKIFSDTNLFNKSANLNCLDDFAGSKILNAGKNFKAKHWDPPPVGWLKRNTGASRMEANRLLQLVIC